MKNKVKMLYLDIENSPSLGYVWGKYDQDVISFKQEWYMLSFAYKWEGKQTRVMGLNDYKGFKNDKTSDFDLALDLWHLLDEADIVIGHNIDKFDIRKINARFLYHGLPLPSTYKTVDTLKVARKMFLMNSNKLDHLAKYLGIGGKLDTGGFDLWLSCMAGDRSAWKKMKDYNKQDVELTEKVYKALRPYITNHPNQNVINGTTHNCPSCNSDSVHRRGYSMTRVGKYQRYQCNDCGAWSTGEKINSINNERVVLK